MNSHSHSQQHLRSQSHTASHSHSHHSSYNYQEVMHEKRYNFERDRSSPVGSVTRRYPSTEAIAANRPHHFRQDVITFGGKFSIVPLLFVCFYVLRCFVLLCFVLCFVFTLFVPSLRSVYIHTLCVCLLHIIYSCIYIR